MGAAASRRVQFEYLKIAVVRYATINSLKSSPVRHYRASRGQCLRSAGKFFQKIQKNRFYYTVYTQNIQGGILFSGRLKNFLYAPGFSSIHFSKASGSQAKRCVDLHSKALGAVAFSQPSRNIPRIFIHALPGKSASFIL